MGDRPHLGGSLQINPARSWLTSPWSQPCPKGIYRAQPVQRQIIAIEPLPGMWTARCSALVNGRPMAPSSLGPQTFTPGLLRVGRRLRGDFAPAGGRVIRVTSRHQGSEEGSEHADGDNAERACVGGLVAGRGGRLGKGLSAVLLRQPSTGTAPVSPWDQKSTRLWGRQRLSPDGGNLANG